MGIDNNDKILEDLVHNSNYKHFKQKKLSGAVWLHDDLNKPTTKWDSMSLWQNEWKLKFKNGLYFYVDSSNTKGKNNLKNILQQKMLTFKKKIMQNGGKIEPMISQKINVVITNDYMQSTVKFSAFKDVKVWDLDKLGRFFQNYEIDLKPYINVKEDELTTTDLSINYITEVPHIYMYHIQQEFKPLIIKKWDIQIINNTKKKNLPYPILQIGSYGRCPFNGDKTTDETKPDRIKKRYTRDLLNQRYALKLRKLYQYQAKPHVSSTKTSINDYELQYNKSRQFFNYFNAGCLNSNQNYRDVEKLKLKRFNTMDTNFKSFSEKSSNMPNLFTFENFNEQNNYNDSDTESLSSTDTIATVELSDDIEDYEPRSSLFKETLQASLYNEQYHNIVINTGIKREESEIHLCNKDIKYCEICQDNYPGSLPNHRESHSHKTYCLNDLNYNKVDNLIKLITTSTYI